MVGGRSAQWLQQDRGCWYRCREPQNCHKGNTIRNNYKEWSTCIYTSSSALYFAAAMLSKYALYYHFPACYFILLFIHKRFTWLAIYIRVLQSSCAAAVWIAIVGMPGISIILLALALMTHCRVWHSILMSDYEFDKQNNLFQYQRDSVSRGLSHLISAAYIKKRCLRSIFYSGFVGIFSHI